MKRKRKSEVKDHAIGVIVYHEFEDELKYLILKHRKGHWSFAKGHQDPGETELMTAKRELHEEAGIDDVNFLEENVLIREKYHFISGKGRSVKKDVWYFIAGSNTDDIRVDNKEILAFKWCSLSESEKKLTFRQSFNVLRDADMLIKNQKNNRKQK